MGYDVDLISRGTGELIEVKTQADGIIQVRGQLTASCSVTYNYSQFYYDTIDRDKGLRWLNGKHARETVERLEQAIETLGTEQAESYWTPTPGNAGYLLVTLLEWARDNPSAIWRVG